jgi:hypothetical protein
MDHPTHLKSYRDAADSASSCQPFERPKSAVPKWFAPNRKNTSAQDRSGLNRLRFAEFVGNSRKHVLRVNFAGTEDPRAALFEYDLEAATTIPVIRKPFDVRAEELVSDNSRGDGI